MMTFWKSRHFKLISFWSICLDSDDNYTDGRESAIGVISSLQKHFSMKYDSNAGIHRFVLSGDNYVHENH